jgi:acetyltransferase-like isoleucine patch superfamily enzyme
MIEVLINCDRAIVLLLARIFGIQYVVSYLRNPNPEISSSLLRFFGATIGLHTTIKRSLFVDNAYEDANSSGKLSHLEIGANCYIGDGVYFDLSNYIRIGDSAVISGRVSFVTHADCWRSSFLRARFPRRCAPVRIAPGAWIGFGAVILDGVTVGENAVVAAGSVVRNDVPPGEMWAGTPAKFIRRL